MEAIQHTISNNVIVIEEAFNMPQLQRTRRIWLYLPVDYHESDKHYPVMYMHDGQNLFDAATAFDNEWEIDEILNSIHGHYIVVGIDNSEHRMTEYNFNDHEEYGPGEGLRYMEFITETLKPFIDVNFRTKPQRECTHIAGSSMGGLISLYGAMHFPKVFGSAGIFSPALWLTPNAPGELKPIAAQNEHFPQRFYFYGGAKEGSNMILHIGNMANMLAQYPVYTVDVEIDAHGEHTEHQWRDKFTTFYNWLLKGENGDNQ